MSAGEFQTLWRRIACDANAPTRAEEGAKIVCWSSRTGVAPRTAQPTASDRTRDLLEEIAGGRRGAQLRSQVAAANRGSTPEQVEEAFQEACLRATRGCRGETMGEVYVWLRKTTGTLLRDARERLKREVLVDQSATEFLVEDVGATRPDEDVIRREELSELDALTQAILDRLCERERTIAILHSHGYARKEIAERLGITPRVVKRSVEDVLATGRRELAKFTGYGCVDGHHLVSRYAFGLVAGSEARKAQLHLATCSRCGAMYERLDVWRERVSVLLPVPPVAVDQQEAVSRVVSTSVDAVTASDGGSGARKEVAHTAAQVRDHLTGAFLRITDPTPIAGVRPGAMVAAVVGCIAVGGGATYCVQQNAAGLIGLSKEPAVRQVERQASPQPRKVRAAAAARVATTSAPQGTTTRPAKSARSTTASKKSDESIGSKESAEKRDSLEPTQADEFEPTAPGPTPVASAPAASAASTGASGTSGDATSSPEPQPAAVAPNEPSEFEGP